MDENVAEIRQRKRMRHMYLHLTAYSTAVVALFISDLMTPGPLWFHWPAMVWGVVMGAHFLYCKSLQLAHDEEWADSRVEDIRMKSYDLGHIRAIDLSSKKTDEPDVSVGKPRG